MCDLKHLKGCGGIKVECFEEIDVSAALTDLVIPSCRSLATIGQY